MTSENWFQAVCIKSRATSCRDGNCIWFIESVIDRKSGVDSGLSVGGDWSWYQSGCSILQATSLGGSCGRSGLQGGSRIQSISGSVVLPRTQSYTRAQCGNCGCLEY